MKKLVLIPCAVALTASFAPAQVQFDGTLGHFDPRTPIDKVHTPGDADSLFRIVEPGSYYLPRSVRGKAGKRGIEIVAGGVTIDLMGFSVTGVPGSLEGIVTEGVKPRRGITVRNGYVSEWGSDGIDLTSARMIRVEGVMTWQNGGHGIEVGEAASLVDCAADANGASGLRGAASARVEDCIAAENGDYGIVVEASGTVDGCVSLANASGGISVWQTGAIHNSAARDNLAAGIAGSVVRGCVARENQSGILVTGVVSECYTNSNVDHGIRISGVAESNACWSNGGNGLYTGVFGALVHGNWLFANDYAGIYVDKGSLVEGNLLRSNENGIRADGRCLVRDNFVNMSTNNDYWYFGGDTLRGPEQDVGDGPILDTHPGVNVVD